MITKEQLTLLVNTFTEEKWTYEGIIHELIVSCAFCVNGTHQYKATKCNRKITCAEHAEQLLKTIIKDY